MGKLFMQTQVHDSRSLEPYVADGPGDRAGGRFGPKLSDAILRDNRERRGRIGTLNASPLGQNEVLVTTERVAGPTVALRFIIFWGKFCR